MTQGTPYGLPGDPEVVEIVLASAILGQPFWKAYCTELGKRLGGSTADWAARIRARNRRRGKADMIIPVDGAVTIIEISNELTDEARLALIELDPTAEGVHGQRMKWDTEAQAWIAGKQR
jgi:hypothetical protein